MLGQSSPGRGPVHGQSSENLAPPPLPLTPIETALSSSGGGGGSDNHGSHNNLVLAVGSPKTPTQACRDLAHQSSSSSQSAGVTALLGPSSEGMQSNRPLQPLPFSPNGSAPHVQSSLTHADWPSASELGTAPETSELQTVNEAPLQRALPLPILATVSSSGSGNSSRSVGGCATLLPPTGTQDSNSSAGPPAEASVTTARGIGATASSSSSLSRSMTLLERRTNCKRSMMSISCLSGLNVETLQASMRDTGLAPTEEQEKTMAPAHGWSKTVASAALLGDYEVPHTAATAVSTSSKNISGAIASCTTRRASAARPPLVATPAFRGNGAAACRRASTASPLSGKLGAAACCSCASTMAGAVTSAAGDAAGAHQHAADSIASKTLESIPGALKVVSYNILASRLASTDLYPHCPPSVLSEEYRINLIKEEVRLIDPDILLMEEVSVGVHEESLVPYLRSSLGMEGHHAVITDRSGQPRCSSRPLTASSTNSQKKPSSTRRKFDGLSLAALCDTSAIAPQTPASPSNVGCRSVERHLNCATPISVPTTAVEVKGGDAGLPPLIRAGSDAYQPSRCGGGTITNAPSVVADSPQPSWAPPSFSSMGNTHTTLGTANTSAATPSHGDVLRRGSSALELTSMIGAAEVAKGSLRSPQQRSVAEPPQATQATSSGSPGASCVTAAASAENHRRIEMDGVAVYYKAERFHLLEVVPVRFNALASAEERLTPYEHQKLQVNSHNVALVAVLLDTQAQGVPHVYIVAAVHLIWQRVNAQLWQAHQLLCVIEELKSRYSRADADLVATTAMTMAARRSLRLDSLPTQPPSRVGTPLYHEMGERPCVAGGRRYLPLSVSSAKRYSISSQPPTAASDSAADGGSCCSGTGTVSTSAEAADCLQWRRESAVSTSTTVGGVLVTCVVGGDFNSDRSGAVMEYLRTGHVPEGAQVMGYWKALVPFTPPHRRQTETKMEKECGCAVERVAAKQKIADDANEEEAAAKEGADAAHLSPSLSASLLPAMAAHTPLTRPPPQRAPRLDVSTLPCSTSPCNSGSSLGSPPSPNQPSMPPLPKPDPLGAEAGVPAEATVGALPLQPPTPPRQRQSPPFPSRACESVTAATATHSAAAAAAAAAPAAPTAGKVDATLDREAGLCSSAPTRAVSAVPASPLAAKAAPCQLNRQGSFCFGRGAGSLITSPVSGSVAETTERSAVETVSGPTVDVTPPSRATIAATPTSCARGRSQESHSVFSHSGQQQKTFKSGSPTSADYPFDGSACSTSRHSRRRTSPEPLRSVESSALMDFAQANKPVSRSRSTSEHESVLSNPFGTVGCSMKLPQHIPSDTLSRESSDAGWQSEESHTPQQQLQSQRELPPQPQRDVNAPSQVRKLTSPPQSLSFGSPADNGSSIDSFGKAEHRLKPLPTLSPATVSGNGVFGSLIHQQLSQMDSCEAPPAPKARTKRGSVNEDGANTISGTSMNGSCSTPPASPQVSRRRLNNRAGTTSSATSAESHHRSQAEELHFSLPSSASTSSHASPWPAALEEATPSHPAKGLIDDVTHTVCFSDAYAPYCYRHPSRVSAVNPSTNMEGKVLDHILYEDEHVVCGAVLRLGQKQELPNAKVPSDHYMIGAVLVPIQELHRS